MRRNNRKVKKNNFFLVSTIFALIIFSLVFVFIKVISLDKFIYLLQTSDGGGEIYLVDSKFDNVIKYSISPSVLLNSSRGLGEYKLESLWTLGEKEGYSGKLVSETISINYKIPVYLWKTKNKTNLNIFQRLKILTVSNNINSSKELESFELPNSILVNFVDSKIQESNMLVSVEDLTGSPSTINSVSLILGTMGTKIADYKKGYDENLDCLISGENSEIVKKISNIFDCKIEKNVKNNFNLQIKLGAKFAARF